jgi:spore germination protein KC
MCVNILDGSSEAINPTETAEGIQVKAMRIVLIIILLVTVFISGCWNPRELRSLAIVSAIGVDPGENDNEVKVSFQIVNPSKVASGTSGGMSGRKSTPFMIYSATGNTLFEAIRHAAEKSPREMFFAHVRLLVIGEELAKKGINGYPELFERSHEARLPMLVMISRNSTAEDVVRTLTPLEKINGNALFGKLQFTEQQWSKSVRVQIDDAIRALQSEGKERL